MSFIDKIEQNVKKYNSSFKERKKSTLSLKEVSGGDVAAFTGRAGTGIDSMFAGPFHPEYMELEKTLEKQVKDRKEKRKGLESIEYGGESPLGGYLDINTEFAKLAYDELLGRAEFAKKYSEENTPILDDRWKSTGWEYEFDDPGEIKVRDLVYDDNPEYAGNDFINQSETNWKIINRG